MHVRTGGSLDLGSLSFRFIFMLVATTVTLYIFISVMQGSHVRRRRGKFRDIKQHCPVSSVCICVLVKFMLTWTLSIGQSSLKRYHFSSDNTSPSIDDGLHEKNS